MRMIVPSLQRMLKMKKIVISLKRRDYDIIRERERQMHKFFELKFILPVILGIVIGGLLFALGEYDDAPGLCAIGLSVGFVLIMLGINNTGVIKKGLLSPILLLFLATFVTVLTTVTLLDGEFGDKQWHSAFGFVAAFMLLLWGSLRVRAYHKSKS